MDKSIPLYEGFCGSRGSVKSDKLPQRVSTSKRAENYKIENFK